MTTDHHERTIRESKAGGTEHQSVRFAAKARRRIGTVTALRPSVAATEQPDGTIGRQLLHLSIGDDLELLRESQGGSVPAVLRHITHLGKELVAELELENGQTLNA